MKPPKNTIVMGVSGCGKTTLGQKLAAAWNVRFYDADDFHSPENKAKMNAGIPLTDEDRTSWLETLSQLLAEAQQNRTPIVLACSALKKKYRDVFRQKSDAVFLYLKIDRSEIEERLGKRTDHFMNPNLVESQFRTLEEPTSEETDTFVISREDDELSVARLLARG